MSATIAEYQPKLASTTPGGGHLLPRIRHEVRLLLPYACSILLCQLVIAVSVWYKSNYPISRRFEILPYLGMTLGAGVLVLSVYTLALQSFVSEFHHSTMGSLVVQPVSRSRIWHEKLGVTWGLLLLTLLPAGIYCTRVAEFQPNRGDILGFAIYGFLMVAIIVAAPLLALLTRRPLASLLLMIGYTILLAVTLASIAEALNGNGDALPFLFFLLVTLAGLSAATYAIGYRLFMRLEV